MLFLLIPPAVIAQADGCIRGYVRDKETGEEIVFALVCLALDDTSVQSFIMAEFSNESGYYELRNVPPGKYKLCFRFMEMKDLEQRIIVEPGQILRLNVEMERGTIEMQDRYG
jgi:hypothetical protein